MSLPKPEKEVKRKEGFVVTSVFLSKAQGAEIGLVVPSCQSFLPGKVYRLCSE